MALDYLRELYEFDISENRRCSIYMYFDYDLDTEIIENSDCKYIGKFN